MSELKLLASYTGNTNKALPEGTSYIEFGCSHPDQGDHTVVCDGYTEEHRTEEPHDVTYNIDGRTHTFLTDLTTKKIYDIVYGSETVDLNKELDPTHDYNIIIDAYGGTSNVTCPICGYKRTYKGSYSAYVRAYGTGEPYIKTNTEDQTVNCNESAQFSIQCINVTHYQWQMYMSGMWAGITDGYIGGKGVQLEGCLTNNLIINNLRTQFNGVKFRCLVMSEDKTQKITDPVTLTVIDNLPPSVEVSRSTREETTEPVVLTVTASDLDSGIPIDAYSYDGGVNYVSDNKYTVTKNTTVEVAVRDKSNNVTKQNIVINNIKESEIENGGKIYMNNDDLISAELLNMYDDVKIDPIRKDVSKLEKKVSTIENAFPSVVYGFHIDGNESDPASMVTYLNDAVGFTPAHMDYSAGTFDYGSWKDAFFMPRPCMLKYDGTVDYYLNPNDYTKKLDGTDSDVANTDYAGNAMMEWGQNGKKIWYKVVPDQDSAKSGSVYISDSKVDDGYHAYSFINNQGKLVDHFYTRIYNGSLIDGKLRSLSGQQAENKTTAQQEIDYAKANNQGSDVLWYTDVLADRILINFLLILVGKSTDTQTVFGQGLHTSGSEAINNAFRTGVHNDKGLFYGTNSGAAATYTNALKVFGMENWAGFRWERLAGYINDRGTPKIKLTYGTEDGSAAPAYNLTGADYIALTDCTPQGTNGGYISEMQFNEYGMFAKKASGSQTTYYADGLWFNNGQVNYAIVGGCSTSSFLVGAFSVSLYNAASDASWGNGASLSCKPLA